MMTWQTAVVISLLLLSTITTLMLAAIAWFRRDIAAARPFILLALSLAIWSLFYALEVGATDLATKSYWGKWQYVGITFIPVGWFLFAAVHAGSEQWLSKRRIGLLSIVPLVSIALAFTNERHGLFWADYALNTGNGIATYNATYGPGWYVYFVYAYLLMAIGSLVLLQALRQVATTYRWQLVLLVLSPVLPWISNGLYVARISPIPQLDLAPFAFTISSVILGVGILRFHLLSLLPVARTAVLDSMSEAMVVLDPQQRIVDINPAGKALLNLTADPIGKQAATVLGDWWQTASNEEKATTSREIQLEENGRIQYIRLSITPLTNHRGQPRGQLLLLRDNTLEKQSADAMALAQVKTEFLAKVGHELRTPLNGILGLSEMLDYGIYGEINEQQKDVLQQIIDRTNHMATLVNEVLEQTRLEAGQFAIISEPFAVQTLMQSLSSTVRVSIERKKLTLVTEIAPNLPRILIGDERRIYQIMLNLVDNAIKFTTTGSITVRFFMPDEGHWAFSVQDTGMGIPANQLELIFGAFKQVHYVLTHTNEGLGLGLAIVRQLVDAMDGTITVESQVNVGTRFTVTLPRQHEGKWA